MVCLSGKPVRIGEAWVSLDVYIAIASWIVEFDT